ncbi:hypothetical protein [Vibrio gazogenes]|uniref:Uncharacterized protein n=1 Tax=Vibrio gazogenes TaxID=687 RepID=A0A1Z2SM89_VIBGA|nr:hypothetical protein [Vibrio gazogenes]ASA58217.1 hypothetical protein BSQ33_21285 [Vibrio gazogenes]
MIKDLLFLLECLEKISTSKEIDIEDYNLEINDCLKDIENFKSRVDMLAGAIKGGQELSPLSVLMLVKASLQDLSTGFSNLANELRPIILHDNWEEFPDRDEYESEKERENYRRVGVKIREERAKKEE